MKKMIILFGFLAPLLAQQPDSWRKLTLNRSTVEETVTVLGTPNKDKNNQKFRTVVGDWIDKDMRYRKLEYKDLEGIKKANLYFADEILKAIELEPREKINPNSLAGAYGIDFIPKVGGLNIAFRPQDYERNQGKIYPKNYPLVYNLIGVSDKTFIVARVEQGAFSSFGKTIAGIEDDGASFPGKVNFVQLIAKSLQDQKGLDALK